MAVKSSWSMTPRTVLAPVPEEDVAAAEGTIFKKKYMTSLAIRTVRAVRGLNRVARVAASLIAKASHAVEVAVVRARKMETVVIAVLPAKIGMSHSFSQK